MKVIKQEPLLWPMPPATVYLTSLSMVIQAVTHNGQVMDGRADVGLTTDSKLYYGAKIPKFTNFYLCQR
jgi:hypothetical protein